MADDEHRVKRSRFDQTEPEPRRSRFDRRSRSPSNRQSESARTRSPLSRPLSRSPGADTPAKPSAADPAAAAGALYLGLHCHESDYVANHCGLCSGSSSQD
jgi:hypothetical protein